MNEVTEELYDKHLQDSLDRNKPGLEMECDGVRHKRLPDGRLCALDLVDSIPTRHRDTSQHRP